MSWQKLTFTTPFSGSDGGRSPAHNLQLLCLHLQGGYISRSRDRQFFSRWAEANERYRARHRKTALTIAVIIGLFVLLFTPNFVFSVLVVLVHDPCQEKFYYRDWYLAVLVVFISSAVNPWIYAIQIRGFRNAMKAIVGKVLPCNIVNIHQKAPGESLPHESTWIGGSYNKSDDNWDNASLPLVEKTLVQCDLVAFLDVRVQLWLFNLKIWHAMCSIWSKTKYQMSAEFEEGGFEKRAFQYGNCDLWSEET